jgi:hypothetical protein
MRRWARVESHAGRIVRTAWLLAPLALIALPTRWLASAPSVCLVRRMTGRPCPGCGMTHALSRLAHGDLRCAWRANHRVVIVAPLLLGAWARSLVNLTPSPTPSRREQS